MSKRLVLCYSNLALIRGPREATAPSWLYVPVEVHSLSERHHYSTKPHERTSPNHWTCTHRETKNSIFINRVKKKKRSLLKQKLWAEIKWISSCVGTRRKISCEFLMVTANLFWKLVRLVAYILMSRQCMIRAVIYSIFASNQNGIFMSSLIQGLSHTGLY